MEDLPVFSRYRAPALVGEEGWGWFEIALRRDLAQVGQEGRIRKECVK
jgi:hypothetical protein